MSSHRTPPHVWVSGVTLCCSVGIQPRNAGVDVKSWKPASEIVPSRQLKGLSSDTEVCNLCSHYLRRHPIDRKHTQYRRSGCSSQAQHWAKLRIPRTKSNGSWQLKQLNRSMPEKRKGGARGVDQALVAICQDRQDELRRQSHPRRTAKLY
jgi:hypothetical protein